MSVIRKAIRIGGVLTDPTSVKLSSSAAAYGVKRNDTQAVVVADNTAMTKVSTGVYEYTFADPAYGLTYTYSLEVVYGGETYWIVGSLKGPAAPPAAGSYITVEEAGVYATAEVDASAWTALTADQKAAALVRATDEIDSVRWQGRKYDATGAQGRQFPRVYDEVAASDLSPRPWPTGASGTYGVWDWDADANAAVVPPAVKKATFLQALSNAQGGREARADDRHDGVAAQGANGMNESYAGPREVLCRRAADLLRRYRLRSGRIV